MSEDLKKALRMAKTKKEQEAIIDKYRDEVTELTDEELFLVAGGIMVEETPGGGWNRKK